MTENLLVSIVVPTFEQPEYFKRLLESILIQSYENFEIIVSDDSKTQSVLNICNTFSDKRLKYYKNIESKGSPENWNEGLRKSTGELIKIMHHDDWFTYNDSLEKLVKMLASNPAADFAFCGSRNVSSNNQSVHFLDERFEKRLRGDPKALFLGNHVGAPSATIYRNKNIFFDKNLRWLVDLEFYIRYLLANPYYVFTKEDLVSIGLHDEQITSSCRADKSVDVNEHVYVYEKLSLHREQKYRSHLIKVLSKHMLLWSEISEQLSYPTKLLIFLGSCKYRLKAQIKGK